jgi:OHCU decarboxylase
MDDSTDGLEKLNSFSSTQATSEFLKCCGSQNWAQQMDAARPYATVDELVSRAEDVWWRLTKSDWLEAFRSHPKIGEKKAAASTAVEAKRWSAEEQSGIRDSAQQTLADLEKLNRAYELKFGYIFIVCASGKTSEEMLALLRARLNNMTDDEIRVAAGEQAKITGLRLQKLLDSLRTY